MVFPSIQNNPVRSLQARMGQSGIHPSRTDTPILEIGMDIQSTQLPVIVGNRFRTHIGPAELHKADQMIVDFSHQHRVLVQNPLEILR